MDFSQPKTFTMLPEVLIDRKLSMLYAVTVLLMIAVLEIIDLIVKSL